MAHAYVSTLSLPVGAIKYSSSSLLLLAFPTSLVLVSPSSRRVEIDLRLVCQQFDLAGGCEFYLIGVPVD